MTVESGSRAALIGGAAAFVAALAFLRRLGSARRNAIPSTVRIAALAALIVLASVSLPLSPPVLTGVVAALLLLVFVVEVLEGHPQRPQSQADE